MQIQIEEFGRALDGLGETTDQKVDLVFGLDDPLANDELFALIPADLGLETLDGVLKEGDKVKVKLIGTDPKSGKFKLSRKALIPKPEGAGARPAREE